MSHPLHKLTFVITWNVTRQTLFVYTLSRQAQISVVDRTETSVNQQKGKENEQKPRMRGKTMKNNQPIHQTLLAMGWRNERKLLGDKKSFGSIRKQTILFIYIFHFHLHLLLHVVFGIIIIITRHFSCDVHSNRCRYW